MRAFLDPAFRREFRGIPPTDAEPLPTFDARRFGAHPGLNRLPPRVRLLADPDAPAPAPSPKPLLRRKNPPMTAAQRSASQRAIWKNSVRSWLISKDVKSATQDWEIPRADEKILLEWFDAIDIDRNGSVDAAEIRALLAANLVACSPARLEALFQAAGKRVDQELTMHDFVKVMHRGGTAALFLKEFTPVQKNGAKAAEKAKERAKEKAKPKAPALQRNSSSKSSTGTSGGGGGGLGSNRPSHESDDAYFIPGANGNGGYGNGSGYADGSSGNDKPPAIDDDEMRPLNEMRSDGDLAVLTYRRQRVLTDVRDPSKRGAFATRESFLSKYIPGALPAYRERWATKTAEWSEKDEEAFFALTDAERAGAADGTFFKQQYDVMKAEEEEIEREIREREEAGKELPPLVLQVPKPRSPNNVYAGAGHRVLADPVERVSPRSNLRGSVSLPALQTRS